MLKKVVVDSYNKVMAHAEFFHKMSMEKDQLDVYHVVEKEDLVEPFSSSSENDNLEIAHDSFDVENSPNNV